MEALQRLDRRWLYAALILVILLPLVKPLGIPLRPRSWTVQAFEAIEAAGPGDAVLLSLDYTVSGAPDIHPQTEAIMRRLMEKGCRVILVAFVDQGAQFAIDLARKWEARGKKYGTDIVVLGFAPGVEAAISAFARDVAAVFPRDVRGNPISELPAMKGIKTARDFKVIVDLATGIPGPAEWIRQVKTAFPEVSLVGNVVTVMGPQTLPYVQSGQLAGCMIGLRGAAEYEVLAKQPGQAVAAMDAQSMGHLMIILYIILGNLAYLATRRKKGSRA